MRLILSLAGISLASIIPLSGCDRGYSKDVVQQVASPDGRWEAVVYETNGGATTSFAYEIDLKKAGNANSAEVAELYGALRNEGAYGVNLKWTQADSLHIQYLRAKSIVNSTTSATIDGQKITVSLDAGFNDPSAPGGGMLHNMHNR